MDKEIEKYKQIIDNYDTCFDHYINGGHECDMEKFEDNITFLENKIKQLEMTININKELKKDLFNPFNKSVHKLMKMDNTQINTKELIKESFKKIYLERNNLYVKDYLIKPMDKDYQQIPENDIKILECHFTSNNKDDHYDIYPACIEYNDKIYVYDARSGHFNKQN